MFEVKTKLTVDLFGDFNRFILFGNGRLKILMPIAFILAILLLLTAVYTDFWLEQTSTMVIWSMSIAILILFILIIGVVVYGWIYPKIYAKNAKALFESDTVVVFNEDDFSVTDTGGGISGTSAVKYEELFKVCERKDVIYLFIEPAKAHVIPKKDIVKGTAEELRAFLQSKVAPKKYKLYK